MEKVKENKQNTTKRRLSLITVELDAINTRRLKKVNDVTGKPIDEIVNFALSCIQFEVETKIINNKTEGTE
jgi:hypothetical protein